MPWLCGVRFKKQVRCTCTPPLAYGVENVPVMLGSTPVPLKFLPTLSTTSTSPSPTRMEGMLANAIFSSSGSRVRIFSAGIASNIIVWS